ncbi:DNA-3-methyladenine glycosylase [Segniliparus rugosus]|uniref:Putative 3-methyladenine DNA glycosylase n=1 Tax=Segniliparus rugosus (strain ATCC BAA-974 / DSM 45345 / CCUG 50838 / CIP 108380 / JCM 13579 / CDC 945) TaxID=679197 RepID=E5XPP6_SEGRC|nr:DNA-3-methyladenine glycosylase [Segniliparus rugosus]EFV13644.1 DNA-3-methyladenine glycosylase [Segniliparus rugosus ATCC BAA-974]
MDFCASLSADPVSVARRVLGARLLCGDVVARIVEVEAYGSDPAGLWPDPAAHAYPGPTPRAKIMFGPAGRLYVYRSMGLHYCANVVCGPDGSAGAVLLRAGEIESGEAVVAARRPGILDADRWAKGPGNFCKALGLTLEDNGRDLVDVESPVRLVLGAPVPEARIAVGPRVGISKAVERPWRFWLPESHAVSAFRQGGRKKGVAPFEKIAP